MNGWTGWDPLYRDKSKHLISQEGKQFMEQTNELSYMTHIVFRMYERFDVDIRDPKRFRVEILLSPGTYIRTHACTLAAF